MAIHKKSSASILPITNNEQGICSSVPVPENHQQHENRSPALHASSNNKSICDSQGQEESLKNNMPKFSSHWLDKHWKSTFHTPRGVKPNHRFIVSWLGRIGFTAKGIVYAVMGGLCIATAQHLKGDITGIESPMVCIVPQMLTSEDKLNSMPVCVGSVCISRSFFYWYARLDRYVYWHTLLFCLEIVSVATDIVCPLLLMQTI